MKNGLLLHTGDHSVTRAELAQIPTPLETESWCPIGHEALLSQTEAALERVGFHVTDQALGATHNGNRFFGLLEVETGRTNEEISRVVGLRNSHDQRIPVGLAAGAQVLVCSNLSFSGEVVVHRKHTTHLFRDLPALLDDAVNRLLESFAYQDSRMAQYKDCALCERDVHDITIRALDENVIPASRIPQVLDQWRHPRHDAFKPRNVWSFFNCLTEVLKGRLHDLPRRTQSLHRLCDAYACVAA